MGNLSFLHRHPFGKHWGLLTDAEKQSAAKEVLAEFFDAVDAVDAQEVNSMFDPIKVIYFDNER